MKKQGWGLRVKRLEACLKLARRETGIVILVDPGTAFCNAWTTFDLSRRELSVLVSVTWQSSGYGKSLDRTKYKQNLCDGKLNLYPVKYPG